MANWVEIKEPESPKGKKGKKGKNIQYNGGNYSHATGADVGFVVGQIFKWIGIVLLVIITLGLALIWVVSFIGACADANDGSYNGRDYW